MPKFALIVSSLLAAASIVRAATNDLTALLQQGLFEEEANRNLDAAIASYTSLAAQFDKNRQVAATAVFRLGECYRKLGQTNEATAQYRRILRDFPDQQTLVTLSRQNLAGLGSSAPPAGTEAPSARDRDRAIVEAEATSLEARLSRLQGLDPNQLPIVVQQSYPNAVLDSLMRDLTKAEQDLIQVSKDYSPEHPSYKAASERVLQLKKKISEQVSGVLVSLRLELEVAQAKLKSLRAESQQAGEDGGANIAITDDEEREIRRIQAIIQNSPDLIDAPDNGGWTPLLRAASAGQLRVARYLLDNHANVEAQLNAGSTSLVLAAGSGHKAMVELLLSHNANINAQGTSGYTALHEAALHGYKAVAEVLLAHKADPNARTSEGNGKMTPLHFAAERGDPDFASLLLANGADVNATNQGGSIPLHSAASGRNGASIEVLLSAKANINARNRDGETPLLVAAQHGHSEAARALLAAGADPRPAMTTQYSMNASALHFAVAAGDEPLVRELLEHGADPNLAAAHLPTTVGQSVSWGNTGGTALVTAKDKVNAAIVKLLLDHGADPNVNDGQRRPLVVSSAYNSEILRLLLDYKADPNLNDANKDTALHAIAGASLEWALTHSSTVSNSIARLVGHGANINAQNISGSTPLHYAVTQENTNAVAQLLALNADPNIRNDRGDTPLDVAKRNLPGPGSPPRIIPSRLPQPGAGVSHQLQVSSAPSAPAEATPGPSIADLLRAHGALDNLPHFDRIEISRPSANYSTIVQQKDPNGWNQFNLLEILGFNYEFLRDTKSGVPGPYSDFSWNRMLKFPDLKNVVIHRASPDSKIWSALPVDVEDILDSGDCSRDVTLHWGDIVEIPEADHPVSETWDGFSVQQGTNLVKCLSRTVYININGSTSVLRLTPFTPLRPALSTPSKMSLIVYSPAAFMLRSVLDQSKLVRFSSDLYHVTVTRVDPKTGKKQEWTFDCSGEHAPPFWLRDGDRITVPEKS